MIAEHYNSYANRVNRILKKHGVKLRTKAEAQALAIKCERAYNNRGHSQETKEKIGKSRAKSWAELNNDEREKLSQTYRESYLKRSPEQLENMRLALQKSSQEGSIAERFFIEKLQDAGYNPLHHVKDYVGISGLEVDILMPDKLIALEIDGVFHRKPVHGEKRLENQMKADKRKNAMLIDAGYRVIRVQVTSKSDTKFNNLWNQLEPLLKEDFTGIKYVE